MTQSDTGPDRVLVVGNDSIGPIVARNLEPPVDYLGFDNQVTRRVEPTVRTAASVDEVHHISPPRAIDAAVVTTESDSLNLLAGKRLQLESGAAVLVRLNDPTHRDAFEDLGLQTVCAASTVGSQLVEQTASLIDAAE